MEFAQTLFTIGVCIVGVWYIWLCWTDAPRLNHPVPSWLNWDETKYRNLTIKCGPILVIFIVSVLVGRVFTGNIAVLIVGTTSFVLLGLAWLVYRHNRPRFLVPPAYRDQRRESEPPVTSR